MNAKRSGRDARHAWFAQHQLAFQTLACTITRHKRRIQRSSRSPHAQPFLPAEQKLSFFLHSDGCAAARSETLALGVRCPTSKLSQRKIAVSGLFFLLKREFPAACSRASLFSLLRPLPLHSGRSRHATLWKKRGKSWVITGGWISSRRAGESMSIVLCLIAGARSTSLAAG